jgi:DNA-binding NarL/FixJ family response regulator
MRQLGRPLRPAHVVQGIGMSVTIVVVDDTLEFRAIVRFIMATEPHAMTLVGEAADGEEALSVILDARPDLVITDLLMPRMIGFELLRRIKEERPETKVIVMTSHAEDIYRQLALAAGADAFLSKAVLARDLLWAIRGCVT